MEKPWQILFDQYLPGGLTVSDINPIKGMQMEDSIRKHKKQMLLELGPILSGRNSPILGAFLVVASIAF